MADEKRRLANFEKLFESVQSGYEGLHGEQRGLDYVGHVMGHLESAASIDEKFKPMLESVTNSYYLLEDVIGSLRHEVSLLEFDPARLDEIENRLNEINQLKRKYGSSVEEILEYSSKIEEEIEMITHRDDRIDQLQIKLSSLQEDLLLEGKQLSDLRKKWATKLATAIHQELKHLYMDKTIFDQGLLKEKKAILKKMAWTRFHFIFPQIPGNH